MRRMLEYFRSLLQQAKIGYSRTSALNPVQWVFVISTSGLLGSLAFHAPSWILILFGSFSAITLVLFGFSFVYFIFKNPDALRSEKYSLSKLAIEKGLVGDDIRGLIDADVAAETVSETRLTKSGDSNNE